MSATQTLHISSAIPNDLVDGWNDAANKIQPQKDGSVVAGLTANTLYNVADKNIRSCEPRFITFGKHQKLYLDIMNSVYPFIDYHQHKFDVNLYRMLEIQHTTYYKGDHIARHVDAIHHGQLKLQRKISMIVMLSSQDEYSGGSLFVNGEKINTAKGDIIMFNPNIYHKVDKVEDGVRKVLVIWALGPQWK